MCVVVYGYIVACMCEKEVAGRRDKRGDTFASMEGPHEAIAYFSCVRTRRDARHDCVMLCAQMSKISR